MIIGVPIKTDKGIARTRFRACSRRWGEGTCSFSANQTNAHAGLRVLNGLRSLIVMHQPESLSLFIVALAVCASASHLARDLTISSSVMRRNGGFQRGGMQLYVRARTITRTRLLARGKNATNFDRAATCISRVRIQSAERDLIAVSRSRDSRD